MAEVCCEVVEAEGKSAMGSRAAARRRRAGEVRRWRVSPGAESLATATSAKRRRLSGSDDGEAAAAPRHGVASVCGRRREMEDAVSVRPGFAVPQELAGEDGGSWDFYGVFDGHGCSHVADACRDRMHELVAEELAAAAASSPAEACWAAAMGRSFLRMDAEVAAAGPRRVSSDNNDGCSCRCETPKGDHVGSTALVAAVGPRRVVVANCGDSRAVLCRGGLPVPLSSDHKPDRPDELQRIQDAGGRVIYWDGARVLGVLSMSRAIGDGYLKPFVIPDPEAESRERADDDDCLILATDGLWDVVSNEDACEVARASLRRNRPRACAEAAALLAKLALARGSSDNVSVVVVDLRTNKHDNTATDKS